MKQVIRQMAMKIMAPLFLVEVDCIVYAFTEAIKF